MSTDATAGIVPEQDAPGHVGLSSPPDSNIALNLDASDSELSDLDEDIKEMEEEPNTVPESDVKPEAEPEVEDIGEVTPDHYEDQGRVPVFKPTMFQFKDFEVYVSPT